MIDQSESIKGVNEERQEDVTYFITELNGFIERSKERYTPDQILLYFDQEPISVNFNYINNKYEVVLC